MYKFNFSPSDFSNPILVPTHTLLQQEESGNKIANLQGFLSGVRAYKEDGQRLLDQFEIAEAVWVKDDRIVYSSGFKDWILPEA